MVMIRIHRGYGRPEFNFFASSSSSCSTFLGLNVQAVTRDRDVALALSQLINLTIMQQDQIPFFSPSPGPMSET